ncbi:GntR family transcriptional regulator [Pontiella agarivorans]|uniref:LacI family DNA-binding transcriptional regulator n=1 Tax=Pontiella agarivorans TaxID=3038953 RepID=A0ABU5MVT4_9BACT|nr:LacI family DNA-binding transcriptional regulator [Pontiella agarivorans]MDZ8118329.1 LacI family DNA-binding transcriptional regulator [Pontiella agarivorans]
MNPSKPKYLQISEKIRILIRNQTYKPGDLLPAEQDLAKKYGASRPTVAKALKLLTDEKLVRRRAGFGTQVLAPGKSALTAAFLIPRIHETEIFEPICAGITQTAAEAGMQIIQSSEFSREHDPRAFAETMTEEFIDARVNGVFFTPIEHIPGQQEFNLEIIKRLGRESIRVVLLDRDVYPWPRQTPYDLIGIDNIEAGYIMANHLLGNGCKKLAFVSGTYPAVTVQLRRIGSHEALVQAGHRANTLLDVELDADQPERAAKALRKAGVQGIICANDATAAPLLRALLDLGIDLPHEMQVCGFDDVKYASLLSVPLTSYRQPTKDIGRVAARVMINRIKTPDSPPVRVTLRGQLVIRESSCGPID